jgi:hypothetical protein
MQFEIVAVLGLIALFTHMHIFWIAGLLLALIDLPDFGTSLNRIAGSAEKMAGIPSGKGGDEPMPEIIDVPRAPATEVQAAAPQQGDGATAPVKPPAVPTKTMGMTHA